MPVDQRAEFVWQSSIELHKLSNPTTASPDFLDLCEAWPRRIDADFGDGVRCHVIG